MLIDKIRNCTNCQLHLSVPTMCHPVPGDGPPNAKCMIVIDTLSEEDAIIERPLMDISGQFLDKILKKLDIERQSCYITSAVKCRGEAGTKEKKECGKWLTDEISEIKPRLIFTFGLWPVRYICGLKSTIKLNDIVGKQIKFQDCRVVGNVLTTVVPCQSLKWILGRSKRDVQRLEEIIGENYNAICRKE